MFANGLKVKATVC